MSIPEDDVFPEIVELTIVVEADERRGVRTDLIEPMTESDSVARVAKTQGFHDPSMGSGYILIGDEWVKISKKGKRTFTIKKQ